MEPFIVNHPIIDNVKQTSFMLTQKLADVGCFGVRVGVQLLLLTQIMAEASDLHTEDVSVIDIQFIWLFLFDIQFKLFLLQRFSKLSSQVRNSANNKLTKML